MPRPLLIPCPFCTAELPNKRQISLALLTTVMGARAEVGSRISCQPLKCSHHCCLWLHPFSSVHPLLTGTASTCHSPSSHPRPRRPSTGWSTPRHPGPSCCWQGAWGPPHSASHHLQQRNSQFQPVKAPLACPCSVLAQPNLQKGIPPGTPAQGVMGQNLQGR